MDKKFSRLLLYFNSFSQVKFKLFTQFRPKKAGMGKCEVDLVPFCFQ